MRLPVTLALAPSRTLAAALILAHGAALAGVAGADLPAGLSSAGATLLAASLGFFLWTRVFRLPVRTLTLGIDGGLVAMLRDGSSGTAVVLPQTTVFPWLVVLLLRFGSRTISLALPPDGMSAGGHRQLRLWLRWKASVQSA
ncbi:MAG TPA: protein YgfX [Rhodocyclaceae bacterium]